MPPFVARRRGHSPKSSPNSTPTQKSGRSAARNNLPLNPHDHNSNPPSVDDNKAFLTTQLNESDDSSLSEVDSNDEFEDVLPPKRRKLDNQGGTSDEDEGMDWEDAINDDEPSLPLTVHTTTHEDLDLTLDRLPTVETGPLTNPLGAKKGPSKIERQIRTNTHCMHVQFLLYHNSIRNGWTCDKKLQEVLVDGLPDGCKKEVDRWRMDTALATHAVADKVEKKAKKRKSPPLQEPTGKKRKRNQRDWGEDAQEPEYNGAAFSAAGDPTLRLLKTLSAYWRKIFSITAPGLRKQGHKDIRRLQEEVNAFKEGENIPSEHGERIEHIRDFRKLAKEHAGSRDVGAQLFTALLRGIGLEARLVASLQPIGFGWSKSEDANPPKKKPDVPGSITTPTKQKLVKQNKPRSSIGAKDTVIEILDDDSELSSVPSSDEDQVMGNTTSTLQSNRKYDRDLAFPTYWTEVFSPISNVWISVDPIVLSAIVDKQLERVVFEARGGRADRAKQVHAYVIAYSSDSSAKDVTVRYLKRNMWPGKTKGVRMPVEKVPVYNNRGKVKKYEEFDWFKSVMRSYARDSRKRTIADEIEDSGELVPVRVSRESNQEAAQETLAGYKNSAEFVLERHMRREEALVLGAQQVKTFTTGKGDKAKEEPVYRRKDIVACKTIESWHKDGRQPKEGEQPLKYVPVRAVTTQRKREAEEIERETGEKAKQGLFSRAQTEWIIPPPIENGVIPKNAFNNIDVYVPSMVPKGAVHIPLKGTAKICRKLGIDHAEACTGFEFGNRTAIPIITGVVIAKENEHLLVDAWRVEEVERKKKEKAKREKTAFMMWRKFHTGLRIAAKFKRDHGQDAQTNLANALRSLATDKVPKSKAKPKATKKDKSKQAETEKANDTESGGFVLDDRGSPTGEGGFLRDDEAADQQATDVEGGGFVLDEVVGINDSRHRSKIAPDAPVSLQDLHKSDTDTTSDNNPETEDESFSKTKKPQGTITKRNEPTATRGRGSVKGRGRGRPRSSLPRDANTPTHKQKTQRNSAKKPAISDPDPDPSPSTPDSTTNARETSIPSDKDSKDDMDTSQVAKAARKSRDPHPDKTESSNSSTAAKAAPPRRAARRSVNASAVRSHYFENSDSGGDEGGEGWDDVDDREVAPKKTSRRGRPRKRGANTS